METIRKATESDAETLARISRETFDAAFGAQYAPDDLAAFIETNYAVAKSAAGVGGSRDRRLAVGGW